MLAKAAKKAAKALASTVAGGMGLTQLAINEDVCQKFREKLTNFGPNLEKPRENGYYNYTTDEKSPLIPPPQTAEEILKACFDICKLFEKISETPKISSVINLVWDAPLTAIKGVLYPEGKDKKRHIPANIETELAKAFKDFIAGVFREDSDKIMKLLKSNIDLEDIKKQLAEKLEKQPAEQKHTDISSATPEQKRADTSLATPAMQTPEPVMESSTTTIERQLSHADLAQLEEHMTHLSALSIELNPVVQDFTKAVAALDLDSTDSINETFQLLKKIKQAAQTEEKDYVHIMASLKTSQQQVISFQDETKKHIKSSQKLLKMLEKFKQDDLGEAFIPPYQENIANQLDLQPHERDEWRRIYSQRNEGNLAGWGSWTKNKLWNGVHFLRNLETAESTLHGMLLQKTAVRIQQVSGEIAQQEQHITKSTKLQQELTSTTTAFEERHKEIVAIIEHSSTLTERLSNEREERASNEKRDADLIADIKSFLEKIKKHITTRQETLDKSRVARFFATVTGELKYIKAAQKLASIDLKAATPPEAKFTQVLQTVQDVEKIKPKFSKKKLRSITDDVEKLKKAVTQRGGPAAPAA